jgi:haloalkane dehalogenase
MCHPSDYPFESHYLHVSGYRLHYLDVGNRGDRTLLFLHGVPTWSYTFRHIIPICVKAGYRVVALDLPGFGLSEKPISRELYTMDFLVNVVGGFINQLEISNSVLFAHDWGGVLGLQLASTYEPPFSGLILCNSLLPVEGMKIPFLFRLWRCFARYSPVLPVAMVVNLACDKRLSRIQKHGYNYPFKSGEDKKAIRLMPQLLPFKSGQSGFSEIKKAWAGLAGFEKPVLTLFSDRDPITRGGEKLILERIPGAQNQNHRILHGGHFIQEDAPHEIANHIISFMRSVQ